MAGRASRLLLTTALMFARPVNGRVLLRSVRCLHRACMSSAGDGVERPPRLRLPTAEDVKRATFEQAARLGSTVCAAMQADFENTTPSTTPAELGLALRAMLSTSNGARGFFSVYLTGPDLTVADAEQIPRPLALALNGAPPDAHRALIRMLVASTATWAVHRVLDQEKLTQMTATSSARSTALLVALESPQLLETLFQLRAACRVRATGAKSMRDDDRDDASDDLGLTGPGAESEPAGDALVPSWAEVLIASAKYSPEQKLAVGIAVDRIVHQRLVAGDSSWRQLPPLRAALESASAGMEGRSGVGVDFTPNGLLQISLGRRAQLNALNAAMLGEILDAATSAASASSPVRAVLIRSEDARAFSAGGDVRALTADQSWEGRAATLQLEYAAIAAVAALARVMPVVAIADGVTMGAGLGLFMAANRRLVSCRASVGMPECVIGLIPDAATTHHLTALPPGFVGMYCALTGTALGPADALYAGLGTAHVPSDSVGALEARLREQEVAGLDASLAAFCQPMEQRSTLSRVQAKVDSIFGQPDLEQVRARARRGVVPHRAAPPRSRAPALRALVLRWQLSRAPRLPCPAYGTPRPSLRSPAVQTCKALACATDEVRARLPKGESKAAELADMTLHHSHQWLLACKARMEAGAPAALLLTQHTMQRAYQRRICAFTALQLELAVNQQLLARNDFLEGVACVLGARSRTAGVHPGLLCTQRSTQAGPLLTGASHPPLQVSARASRPSGSTGVSRPPRLTSRSSPSCSWWTPRWHTLSRPARTAVSRLRDLCRPCRTSRSKAMSIGAVTQMVKMMMSHNWKC